MSERELLGVMSAIIFAGADDNESAPGYSPAAAVQRAQMILNAIDDPNSPQAKAERRETRGE